MHISKYKTLEDRVRYILKEHPDARDSDTMLTIKLWMIFKSHFLFHRMGKTCVNLTDIRHLPNVDSISRCRRRIQNTEGLYKGSKKIQKERRSYQEDYRSNFSTRQVSVPEPSPATEQTSFL